MRNAVGVIVGLIAGCITVMLLQIVSSLIYPPPAGMDWTDQIAMSEWIQGLPTGAFVIVLISHSLGTFVAALVCGLIIGRHWVPGTLMIGVLLLIAGIMNIISIPHPIWFPFVDLALYIPAAFLGGMIAAKLRPRRDFEPEEKPPQPGLDAQDT